MPWKSTTPWLVGGLAAAAGFVLFKRGGSPSAAQPFGRTSEVDEEELKAVDEELSAPASSVVRGFVHAERDELRALALEQLDSENPPVSNETARFDALRDMRFSDLVEDEINEDEISEDDLGERTTLDEIGVFASQPGSWGEEEIDPVSVMQLPDNVHPSEHVVTPDETYDAIDTEDIGTEWLRRATEAGGSQERSPDAVLEGTDQIVIDMNDSTLEESEVPLVVDVTEELPLGETDREGNTDFHPHTTELGSRIRSRDALGALSPNEADLENRAAANERAPRRHRG